MGGDDDGGGGDGDGMGRMGTRWRVPRDFRGSCVPPHERVSRVSREPPRGINTRGGDDVKSRARASP